MLHKHKKLGRWMQFGGHIELNENPWQAICHELQEETGYQMSQLKVLQPPERLKLSTDGNLHPVPASYFSHPFVGEDHFHSDAGFILVASESPAGAVSDGEVTEFEFFSAAELAKLDTFADVRDIGLFGLNTCLPNWEQVPATDYN
ncbi:MAG: hypothetical protein QG553_388 [Patescibacteria group bacterium]|nr:hypothetical protein [Patescibacteria group bacterium]